MKTKLLFTLFALILISITITSELFAVGSLFCRPRWSYEQYNKMWIQKVDATVDIQEQIAVTHVDQTFYNEMNNSVEAIYIFPLPEDATITELIYWINGVRFIAAIKERAEAIREYNEKLRQWMDPALLESLGNNLFRLSIVPIDPLTQVRTEITYIEPLKYDMGIVQYKFQLNTMGLSSKPLQTVSVNLESRSQNPYTKFYSPTHGNSSAAKLTMISENHYKLFYGDENFYPDKDLVIEFETKRDQINYKILTYNPSPQDSMGSNSFYALWITPPDQLPDDKVLPKDIVFTVDISSSMEGERIVQLKDALEYFLQLLNSKDRFNIITFGTFVSKFKSDLVEASENNVNEAKNFILGLYALGMTNIDEALKVSFQQSFGDSTLNNLIFLTDGYPTWGEKNQDSILARVKRYNNKEVRLFTFGVGSDISRTLLGYLAAQNHGYAKFITKDDSIALVVKDHFDKISKPVLSNIQINYDGLQAWDNYPKTISDLFWGSQILQVGLYKNSGTFNITLKGRLSKDSVSYVQSINFSDTIGGHKFVPRLWARAKINYILNLIQTYGESEELITQITELSLRFQILTPYTAMYVDPTDPTDPGAGTEVDKSNDLPQDFVLEQNYPNPFNPTTNIMYSLPAGQSIYHITIKIYDMLGRLVRVLVDTYQDAGVYTVVWDSKNSSGSFVPSGTYFYTIESGSFRETRKMILLR
jgi:Ca-activated chloride channel family protein